MHTHFEIIHVTLHKLMMIVRIANIKYWALINNIITLFYI